ncbi:hypothetical protein [Paracoccus sp. KR1-242]|uniref:hypothetical protein n=1 Tax=Paracoccus sp. KR1-242 TaxID=3410028 RepID=UPI003C09AD9F
MLNASEDRVEYVLSNMIEAKRRQPSQRISSCQVKNWAGGSTNDRFFNLLGLKIAERYAAQTLSYDVADAIINDLWAAWLEGMDSHAGEIPDPFYDIYLAFDAGEGLRSSDRDPVREVTDPWIASILSEQRL